ncbi:MAG: Holliday junction branch migration protein RuvA [Bacteroidales bacterium]|nr:Holliday junction branch migration protein RuvA [Bacteroidales bacterium]
MIDYISGKLTENTPAYAVIECNGVGYLANISLTTYSQIKDQKEAKLLIHEAIREDAYNLYGFATKEERDMFRLLLSVSGIGASTARIILSAHPTAEVKRAIKLDDINTIKSIKGIGLKTAQRLIVELRDKVDAIETGGAEELFQNENNKTKEEALSALEVLGFPKSAAQKVVEKIVKDNPDMRIEGIVKLAIKLM